MSLRFVAISAQLRRKTTEIDTAWIANTLKINAPRHEISNNVVCATGELCLSENHTMTGYEMSGEPHSQKSGWINHSNERIFQVMTFFAQSLIGDWRRVVVAGLDGFAPPHSVRPNYFIFMGYLRLMR